jgi:hypothetical protein
MSAADSSGDHRLDLRKRATDLINEIDGWDLDREGGWKMAQQAAIRAFEKVRCETIKMCEGIAWGEGTTGSKRAAKTLAEMVAEAEATAFQMWNDELKTGYLIVRHPAGVYPFLPSWFPPNVGRIEPTPFTSGAETK